MLPPRLVIQRARQGAAVILCGCGSLLGVRAAGPVYNFNTTVATVVGSGTGPAEPSGMVKDAAGNLYVVDTANDAILVLSASGAYTTFAGHPGSPGAADGPGTAARFSSPTGLAIDAAGNLYVADTGNDTLRMVTPAGAVTTVCGAAGQAGSQDGSGAGARFNGPQGVFVAPSGVLYVTDTGNDTLRMFAPGGAVTTVAGQPGVAGSADGVASAAQFSGPTGVAMDPLGNVYVVDTGNDTIRSVSPQGLVTTLAGAAGQPGSQDGLGPAARFSAPTGIAVDAPGIVYIADTGNDTVRILLPSPETVSTAAGTPGAAGAADGNETTALFSGPTALAYSASDNTVYVADTGNRAIRHLSVALKPIPTISVQTQTPLVAVGQTAYLESAASYDGNFPSTYQWLLNGVAIPGATISYLYLPRVQASDAGVYSCAVAWGTVTAVSNPLTLTVNPAVTFTSQVLVVPFASGPNGVAVDAAGDIYCTVADAVLRYSGGTWITVAGSLAQAGWADGAGAATLFSSPTGLVTDSAGNLYVADTGNNRIRVISPAGLVTTLAGSTQGAADGSGGAAQFDNPVAVAVSATGTVLVADAGNNELRLIRPDGTVSTLLTRAAIVPLGGQGNGSFTISGVAFDNKGFPIVAASNALDPNEVDSGQVALGRVTAAGNATLFSQEGSWAASGTFGPLANDAAGNLYSTLGPWVWVNAPGYSAEDDLFMVTVVPQALAVGSTGIIYGADPASFSIVILTPSGAFPSPPAATTISSSSTLVSSGSAPQTVPVPVTPPSRLANLSSRAMVGSGASVEIAGFVIAGGSGGTKQVLIRGAGPALAQFGVSGALHHPQLTLLDAAGNTIATNSGWSSAANASAIASAATAAGAFPFQTGSADAALLVSLPPGAYTAQISGADGGSGVALAEIYETSEDSFTLADISARAEVGSGADVEIAGLVIQGTLPKQVLVRAVGPTLAQFDVPGVLAAPTITVLDASSTVVATNAGWSNNPSPTAIAAAATSVGAFALPAGSADDALLITLNPGSYTVTVAGAGPSEGVALVEVYQVQ